jgi:predicted regulator of Ras-like GTPase activity (Roadblock/LC7/MglB family)
MSTQSPTRQDELIRVMNLLADNLHEVQWIALVDQDGLLMACVPPDPGVQPEGIAAMTAALTTMGERILGEIDGGRLRYTSVAGSYCHHMTVMLPEGRLLTLGLPPEVQLQKTFRPIRQWIPELLKVLGKRFTTS